jgi:predicted amidohydrolase YtcJ
MFVRLILLFLAAVAIADAQPATFSSTVRGFIKVDAPVVALTNARVIDGTGAPGKENQTLVVRGGIIAEIGDASRVKPPDRDRPHREIGDPRPGHGARAHLLPDRT